LQSPDALADLIGLKVLLAVMQAIHDECGDSKYRPCPLLREMVAAGYLGRKTRRGVYWYWRCCEDRSHHNSPKLTLPHSTVAQSGVI
jgi:3-hydroxyacyl-CoA dehydrogenase